MRILFVIIATFLVTGLKAQVTGTYDSAKKVMNVDASCGKCKFGLTGKTCELAVKIKGTSYYVDGASIDSFGDAHDDGGFCNAVRKAQVQGTVVNGRFQATYFRLLPQKRKKK